MTKAVDRWRDFIPQAREDQKVTSMPGCMRGVMDCLDQSCGCSGLRPNESFVVSRAYKLAREVDRSNAR